MSIDKGLSINCLKERRLENLMTQYFTGLLGGKRGKAAPNLVILKPASRVAHC